MKLRRLPWKSTIIGNEAVWDRVKPTQKIADLAYQGILLIKKLAYLQHTIRRDWYKILHKIMQGKIEDHSTNGRKHVFWLRSIFVNELCCKYTTKNIFVNWEELINVIAKVKRIWHGQKEEDTYNENYCCHYFCDYVEVLNGSRHNYILKALIFFCSVP